MEHRNVEGRRNHVRSLDGYVADRRAPSRSLVELGAVPVGRRTFEVAHGWGGNHAWGR
jgi:hypothetical protein